MEKRVPEIRFEGFEEPWEKKKLGNIAKETYGGGTPSTIDDSFWDGNIPWFQSSDLSEDKLFDVTQRKHISCDGLKNSSAQLISKNSIAIVTRVGVGKVAFIPYEYTTSQDFLSLSKLQTEPVFTTFALYKMLKNDSQSLQGTSIKGITKEDLLNKSILAPQEFNEQKRIGSYLHTLDELVNIQQQKLDQLKTFKKACLEKMFPKEGETVPEIRFKGFEGPWKRGMLSEFLEVSSEKNLKGEYSKLDVLSVSGDYGIVNQIEFQGRSYAGASVSNYGVVLTGDIVYTKSPLSTNPYGIIKTNKGRAGIVSTLYAVYHPLKDTCAYFVQTYFEQNARMNNYMHPLVNKGAKNDMKVSAENALKGIVCFPSYNEQKEIADFFVVLDNRISLQQQKINKLKSLKQACLEKMFV